MCTIVIAKVAHRKVNARWDLARVVCVSVGRPCARAHETPSNSIVSFAVTASCDQEVKNNITYIVSPSFPALMSSNIKSCKFKVKMMSPDISQLRFDFVHFSMVSERCVCCIRCTADGNPFSGSTKSADGRLRWRHILAARWIQWRI